MIPFSQAVIDFLNIFFLLEWKIKENCCTLYNFNYLI